MSTTDLSPVKRALLALEKMSAKVQELELARTEPIAIVGMACRVPGASDPDRFWQLLANGVDAVGEVPKSRWNVDALYDKEADKPGKIASRRGGFIEPIDEFDPEFFGISPREALAMDPQQRLLLEVAWEALEHAGQSPASLADSPTGVFLGITSDEYAQMFHKAGDVNRFDMYFASGIARSVAAGRISYVLGLHGPSLSIDTACSSSLVAVHTACLHLRAGECRAALAGGVNIILSPEVTMALSRGHMFAADGRCKAFDAAADGFVRAEGCGMVVLKRLSDAVADGDNILALIRGSAVNQDGRSSGLTVPNGPAQEAVIRQALANGRVEAADIDYVEAHGTGTSLGDPIEAHALAAVLGGGRDASHPLVVGSVKTNLGHLEAAAGIAGLIKVVLSLQHQRIPAHLHFQSMNPHIDWKGVPVQIPVEGKDWKQGTKPRLAGVSSFGFSGTNAHVILQEAPTQESTKGSAPERGVHLLALSARSETALASLAQLYAERLLEPEIEVGDACFTANTGRTHFSERAVYVASTREQLQAKLAEGATIRGGSQRAEGLRIAFLFSGQGAQYAGMGRELYESEPVFRSAMDACAAAVKDQLEPGLIGVLYGNSTHLLDDTRYTQPALFAVEYSLAALWRSWGVEPAVVLGHSVGEYAAACVAGLYALEDGMRLIAARGRMMSDLPHGEGSMAAILAPLEQVQPALEAAREWVSVAGLNGPENTVISGRAAEVEQICAGLASAGVRVERLRVSHAFHSPLMNPMLDAFASRAGEVEFRAPRIVLVSSLTGQPGKLAELRDPGYWRRQVREPVRFQHGVETLAAQGCNVFVEIGPGSTLLGMARACLKSKEQLWAPSIRKAKSDAQQMADSLASLYVRGVEVDWNGYEAGRGRRRISLPTYPFERQRYWIDDLAPAPRHSQAPGEHPLLGRRMEVAADPGATLWQTSISLPSHPWIADHRVQGVVILPMTAYLEMMSAALSGPVSEVVIREPLIVPDDSPVEVQIAAKPNSVEVYSRQAKSWKLHASGKPGVYKPHTDADLNTLRSGLSPRGTAEEFYRDLAARGHAFGPRFRLVREIFSGPSEALAEVDAVSPHEDGYRFHPALLDACVQTIAGAMEADNRDSFLPVGVGHFEILSDEIPERIWSHARIQQGADVLTASMNVTDGNGRTLVQIHNLELRRMTAEAISRFEGSAAGNVFFAPSWEPSAHDLNLAKIAVSIRAETPQIVEQNGMNRYAAFRQRMDVACAQAIRIALEQLGAPLNFGARFRASDLALRCGVLKRFSGLLNRFLEIMGEDGILRQTGAFWEYVLLPPAGPADWKGLEQRFPEFAVETRIVARCAEGLSGVLRGTINELTLLFPGGSTEAAERLYSQSPSARAFNQLLSRVIPGAIPENGNLKILEIGGGTGGTSSFVLPLLPADRASYTFTDISPLFVSRAKERFAEYGFVSYSTLNIEQDPLAQGLRAEEFDIVIAANVLHATADLKATLANVRTLLKPGGVIVLLEVTRKERWIDVSFGLTDGWWRFTDRDLRPSYPLLSPGQWKGLLEDNGFSDPEDIQAGSDSLNAVLFAKKAPIASRPAGKWLVTGRADLASEIAKSLQQRGAQCMVAANDFTPLLDRKDWAGVVFVAPSGSERAVCEPFLELVHGLHSSAGRLVIVTTNAQPAIPSESLDPAQATLWGFGRTVASECPGLKVTCVDLSAGHLDAGKLAGAGDTVAREVCATDGETEVAYRGGLRFLNRVRPVRLQDRGRRLRLSVANRGALDNLQIEAAPRRAPGAGQVEIEVDVAGMGFRDVLNVLGMYPGDPGPLGAECAGRIAAVGEGVTKFKPGDEVIALAAGSHDGYVLADAALVVRRPAALPMEDAMTMPVPYVTALYALEHLGKIRRGERVLIHSGAGGVGLAAIRVAQRAGAEIFATAGSEEKRALLRSLGVQHVMNSRSARFADEIGQITNGQGVDLVLNSLAGDTISASFACLSRGGRFLEIGKNGIWSDEQVEALGKDISYFVIDWSQELKDNTGLIAGLLTRVMEDAGGALQPLPRTVFAFADARAAYRHMMQGRHTGRVLLRQESPIAICPDRTYLITGGLTGIGLITAENFVARGARHLVLVGRREPSAEALRQIAEFERKGVRIHVAAADVAERRQMDRLFEFIAASMPPLGGVVHSAGTLDDALVGDQSWARFESVFRSKVRGTWNLHELTSGAPLDFFLLYSSIASVLGAPGQANHAAASAFEDAFAWMRRAKGLPATSINWGAWTGTGSADRAEYERRREQLGLSALTPAQGIQYLDRVLAAHPAQIAVAQINWTRYADGRFVPKPLQPMLDAAADDQAPAKAGTSQNVGAPALLDELRSVPESNRLRVLQNHVQSLAAKTLGLPEGRKIDERRPLNELGLDSLMAVEFRNALAAAVGRPLPVTLLFSYPAIGDLTNFLAAELWGAAEQQPLASAPSVIDAVEELSDEEVDRLLAEKMGARD